MRKTDHTTDIQRLRRLVIEALAIADQGGLLDVGICLDGALVRLSEIDGHGVENETELPFGKADRIDN